MATNIFTQTQISASQSQKEVTANEQDVSLKNGIRGLLSKSVAGGANVTLTEAEAENAIHQYTGTLTANINVIVPTASKIYTVYNNTSGAYTLNVKTSGGTGVAITQGTRGYVYCDGTNVVDVLAAYQASLLPVADTQTIIKGSADATKLLRFEVDGFTTGTTRVVTFPDADITVAGLSTVNSFTAKQTFGKATVHTPVVLSDGATIATDASLGNRFRVTLGGNRTLGAPTNPTDGQQCLWEITQDGTGSRTLSLTTGAAGFIFGTDITSITLTTTASKTDYLTAIYNQSADRWRVVGFTKGF